METKIISFFNKIFNCLENDKIKTFEDFINPKIIYAIGLEIDNKLFSELEETITGEDNLGIRISELTELTEIFLNILKPPQFIATKKYKEEIELIDVIGLANKEHKNIEIFTILIIITIFHCEKHEYFITKINNLPEDEKTFIYDLVRQYSNIPNLNEKDKKSDISCDNNKIDNYKDKITKLENELKEKDKKLKIIEEEYNNLKNKITNFDSKNISYIIELNNEKNKNKELEKIIEEKNNKLGILQKKLDEKIKIIKERDTQLNKEIENNMDLNCKLNKLNTNNDNNINNINNKNNINDNKIDDYEQKYKNQLKINEDLNNEIIKLNDLINVMEIKLNEKNKDEIESDMNNIRINDDIEKKIKKFQKEKEDLKNHYKNEFELMSSAIYNLGFQFWSLKLEDSEKLKQTENWLVRERIKQYNGDY